ncbi:hypothetical protein [Ruminococcus sp.]
MLLPAFCFAGVLFALFGSVIWLRGKNVIEAAVIGIVFWFFTHIFASMVLFAVDEYNIIRAAFGAMVISASAMAAALYVQRRAVSREKKLFGVSFSLNEMLIPIIISILALPFVLQKNEFFGMGQDQGVYQIQAVYFINGDTKRQKDMSEYYELETDHERDFYEEAMRSVNIGYDIPPEDYPETSYDKNVGKVSGIFHGIPAYTALLALCGKLFGLSHMQDFETVLFICLIFLVYFICGHLKLKKSASVCACAVTAFSPIVIWSAKSALTEMMLAMIPAVFLYFITDDDAPANKGLSVIPVFVFGCFHVSFYTVLPMFILIYGGMYVFTREKRYAVFMPVITAFYAVSFLIMRHIQPVYVLKNYDPLYVGGISIYNVSTLVLAVSAAALIAVTGFAVFIGKRTKGDFSKEVFLRKISDSEKFLLLLRIMLMIPCISIVGVFIINTDFKQAAYSSLFGFVINAGTAFFILGFLVSVKNVKYFAESTSRLVLFIMFFYCVLIYSAFLRRDMPYYYYYARYITPYVSVAVIYAAAALDKHGIRLTVPAAAVSLLCVAGFDKNLMLNKDDTLVEWSIIEDLADNISEKDCVVISDDYSKRLWLVLRNMTGAGLYPMDNDDSGQLDRLAARYGCVDVLTSEKLNDGFSPVYMNKNHISNDEFTDMGKLMPLPKSFFKETEDVRLYSYDKNRYLYTAVKDHGKMDGVTETVGDLCWTNEETAGIRCSLPADDYELTVELGCEIPLDRIKSGKNEIKVLLNGNEIGKSTITPENNGKALHFSVNSHFMNDGENELCISGSLWQAGLMDISDTSKLPLHFDGYGRFYLNPIYSEKIGIPIRSVRFTPVSR